MPRRKSGAPLYVSDVSRQHAYPQEEEPEETRSIHAVALRTLTSFGNEAHLSFFFLHNRHRPTTRQDGSRRAVSFRRFGSPVSRFLAAISSHSCSSRRMNDSFATPCGVTPGIVRGNRRPRRNHVEWTARRSSNSERCCGMSRSDGMDGRMEKRVGGEGRRGERSLSGGRLDPCRKILVWLTHGTTTAITTVDFSPGRTSRCFSKTEEVLAIQDADDIKAGKPSHALHRTTCGIPRSQIEHKRRAPFAFKYSDALKKKEE